MGILMGSDVYIGSSAGLSNSPDFVVTYYFPEEVTGTRRDLNR